AVDVVVGDPDRVVMAVTVGIAGMPHPGQRFAARADDRIEKRPAFLRAEMVAGDFFPLSLNGGLVVWQGENLHQGDRFGARESILGEKLGGDQNQDETTWTAQGANHMGPRLKECRDTRYCFPDAFANRGSSSGG